MLSLSLSFYFTFGILFGSGAPQTAGVRARPAADSFGSSAPQRAGELAIEWLCEGGLAKEAGDDIWHHLACVCVCDTRHGAWCHCIHLDLQGAQGSFGGSCTSQSAHLRP